MENDNLILWKLKHGKTFLDSFLKCGHKVYDGKKCFKARSIRLFIKLGLLQEISDSKESLGKNKAVKLGFTNEGISIYDQLLKQINRGIIYKDHSGELNWKNFQFV